MFSIQSCNIADGATHILNAVLLLCDRSADKLQVALSSLGIEASMWRDLVWNFKRCFGRASCAGSPESMAADAARTGKRFHRCERQASECFAGVSYQL
jgi:hypothetical protein